MLKYLNKFFSIFKKKKEIKQVSTFDNFYNGDFLGKF